nr:RNA polymerase sigma factor [Caulobacter sp. 17J65-9]
MASRAADGDQRAFSAIMRRYKEPLYRLIARHVGDRDDAYDVLQQTFVSAWGAIGRFDPKRPLDSWLRTIALNKCRDFGRRRTVKRLLFQPASEREADVASVPAQSTWAGESSGEDERFGSLELAIAKLPAALKEPLILTALEGLSQTEAADLLGVSVKAVETRVYRARRKLAELMTSPGDT